MSGLTKVCTSDTSAIAVISQGGDCWKDMKSLWVMTFLFVRKRKDIPASAIEICEKIMLNEAYIFRLTPHEY